MAPDKTAGSDLTRSMMTWSGRRHPYAMEEMAAAQVNDVNDLIKPARLNILVIMAAILLA